MTTGHKTPVWQIQYRTLEGDHTEQHVKAETGDDAVETLQNTATATIDTINAIEQCHTEIPSIDEYGTTVEIPRVYHVGNLDGGRTKPHFSYEGRGVSVSVTPKTWSRIAATVRGRVYEFRKRDARFYAVDPSSGTTDEAVEWCLDNDFVVRGTGWRVAYGGTEYVDRRDFIFTDYEKANIEREEGEQVMATEDGNVTFEETSILMLGHRGHTYWHDAFKKDPDDASPIDIRGLTPIWYAEAMDYDGVWWDLAYDPQSYSAPKGVIFQEKLESFQQTVHSSL